MDAYWDDASLVTTAPGIPPTSTPPPESTPLPEPDTPTPGPSPTPLPTATPRPDGATVHVVESGETLYGIALRYGVSADQIRELNPGSIGPNDLIQTGQELVISVSGEAATATPLPEPTTATPEGEPEATPSPTEEPAAGASICVLAFHDRNGDTVRDPDAEELMPNVKFTLADASGVVAEYSTDGVSEPYCFTELDAGSYRVIQEVPTGYEPTGLSEQNVALGAGTSFDFEFGSARIEEAPDSEETDEEAETSPPDESGGETGGAPLLGNLLVTVARVAGILVLVLAGAIAVLFVLSRRRRRY
ncbi:MAG: LysM peptidoglycan-binding domain-containing protein, partial [Anaerolineae bacterium]